MRGACWHYTFNAVLSRPCNVIYFGTTQYNRKLSPCDFLIFGHLKKALRGCWFQLDAKVQQSTWLLLPTKFYEKGIMHGDSDAVLCTTGSSTSLVISLRHVSSESLLWFEYFSEVSQRDEENYNVLWLLYLFSTSCFVCCRMKKRNVTNRGLKNWQAF